MEELQTYIPKKMPFRCVVCNGFGTVKHGTITCQGCNGKGWVVVDQEDGNTQGDNYGTQTNA